jgi:hypothetical protein
LKEYFQRLFSMAQDAVEEQTLPSTIDEFEERFISQSVTAFIRPDMACNIYSLVDFWLARLCSFHKRKSNLPLGFKDIKAKSQLKAYHKYLTKVAALDLRAVSSDLEHLDSLRKVRNYLIHTGAHVDESQCREIENIAGVSVHGSLIALSDAFIWDSLDHAQSYLCAVARA